VKINTSCVKLVLSFQKVLLLHDPEQNTRVIGVFTRPRCNIRVQTQCIFSMMRLACHFLDASKKNWRVSVDRIAISPRDVMFGL